MLKVVLLCFFTIDETFRGYDRVQKRILRPFVRAAAASTSAPADSSISQRHRRPHALPYRVGHGFDLHRLEEGPYKLILGGLEIPHDRGCVAHSDGGPSTYIPDAGLM